jgi:hypothetical protein
MFSFTLTGVSDKGMKKSKLPYMVLDYMARTAIGVLLPEEVNIPRFDSVHLLIFLLFR